MLAEWSNATAEDAALIRQAVRENWPVANGEPILEAITSAISPVDRPRQALRVARLLIGINRKNVRKS